MVREIFVPLDPKESTFLKERFRRTVRGVKTARSLLEENDTHFWVVGEKGSEKYWEVDGKVIKAMQGAVLAMYDDLVAMGESEFADGVLHGSQGKTKVEIPEAFRA